MFVSNLGEAVVSRHEKIVTGDMRCLVKWWTVRWGVFGVFVPTELSIVVKCPPCGKRTSVSIRNSNLTCCAWKLADGLLPEITLSVPVIERDVPD